MGLKQPSGGGGGGGHAPGSPAETALLQKHAKCVQMALKRLCFGKNYRNLLTAGEKKSDPLRVTFEWHQLV